MLFIASRAGTGHSMCLLHRFVCGWLITDHTGSMSTTAIMLCLLKPEEGEGGCHGCVLLTEAISSPKIQLKDRRHPWCYLILTLDRSEALSSPLGSSIALRQYIPFSLRTVNVLPCAVYNFEGPLLYITEQYLVSRKPRRHGYSPLYWWG